jgi:hypothetical protein
MPSTSGATAPWEGAELGVGDEVDVKEVEGVLDGVGLGEGDRVVTGAGVRVVVEPPGTICSQNVTALKPYTPMYTVCAMGWCGRGRGEGR